MSPEFIEIPDTRDITGLAVRTSNARERDPRTAVLPGLWARFAATRPDEDSGLPAAVFSVYTEYESDVHGAYSVVLGREAGSPTSAEHTVHVPAGRYAVFTSTGEMPAAVLAGWQQVWAYFAHPGAPARAYTTDFEHYDPAQPSTVRIHIAVHEGDLGVSKRDAG
jgi:predicted transcriptional regulator YdeE